MTNIDIPWVIPEQTKVKHALLEAYISPWMRILFQNQANRRYLEVLLYFDGFSGPGIYYLDESKVSYCDGSPLLVASVANRYIEEKRSRAVHIMCIDKSEECVSKLRKQLRLRNMYDQDWRVEKGEFESKINELLDRLEMEGLTRSPMFFFVDPFGYEGFSMNTMARIMKYPIVELFINFMIYDIVRFLLDPGKQKSLLNLFGSENYAEECSGASDESKYWCLVNLYCKNLKTMASCKYVMPFRVNTPGQGKRPRYFLIHASKNIIAFRLMKDVMHTKSDSLFRFEAIGVNSDQMSLFEEPDKVELTDNIFGLLSRNAKGCLDYDAIEEWAYTNTNGVKTTIKEALIRMEKEGRIKIERAKGQHKRTVATGAKVYCLKNRNEPKLEN